MVQEPDAPAPPTAPPDSRRWLMLAIATLGFVVNFWAWALLSPLGPKFRQDGILADLTQSDVALMVAVPVLVGSVGRIIVGALTDRYGGRIMFPAVSALTVLPILFLAFFALDSYTLLLVGGFFLGIGGTAFAVGVPFVNSWFPPKQRGLAIGIFGAGMGGTAISALTTVSLYDIDEKAPFLITAAVLAIYAVVAWVVLRDAPGRTPPPPGFLSRLLSNAKLPITWQASLLYAVAFGGYVAFSVYLPTYLMTAHDLTAADASNRMAGFVVIAVAMRPVGGALSDKVGAIRVLSLVFAVTAVCAAIASFEPPLDLFGTLVFLAMAAALGAGSGAVFALIAQVTEPARVGGVTGIVGAAGGLGGFIPPLIMGYVYSRDQTYAIGLLLLAGTAVVVLILTLTTVRRLAEKKESVA